MKTLIRSVPETSGSEYQLWAELVPAQGPGELFCLRFSSVWTGAKNPAAAQIKGEFFLQQENLRQLKTMIEGQLQ